MRRSSRSPPRAGVLQATLQPQPRSRPQPLRKSRRSSSALLFLRFKRRSYWLRRFSPLCHLRRSLCLCHWPRFFVLCRLVPRRYRLGLFRVLFVSLAPGPSAFAGLALRFGLGYELLEACLSARAAAMLVPMLRNGATSFGAREAVRRRYFGLERVMRVERRTLVRVCVHFGRICGLNIELC